jgi:hypothetical protein
MEAWHDEGKAVISSMSWKKPQQGSTECTCYMMCNLLQYLKAQWKGLNTILNGGKRFTTKDAKEL